MHQKLRSNREKRTGVRVEQLRDSSASHSSLSGKPILRLVTEKTCEVMHHKEDKGILGVLRIEVK